MFLSAPVVNGRKAALTQVRMDMRKPSWCAGDDCPGQVILSW